jgi:hypothetical protein
MRRLVAMITASAGLFVGANIATPSTFSSLHAQARYTAMHGGILGSCYGCATPRMKYLARQLVIERFGSAGSYTGQWALCVVGRESGFNPGAINSSSGAAGMFQFLGHPQYSYWSLTHDPVYQVSSAWQLSHGGRDKSPWYGGGYNC